MRDTHHGSTRIVAFILVILSIYVMSACGAKAPKDISSATLSSTTGMAEKVAPSITARIEFLLDDAQQHPGSVSEQQQDILRRALDHDGVIPRGDYDAAWSRYQDCVVAKGYTKPVVEEFVDGLRSPLWHATWEGWSEEQHEQFIKDNGEEMAQR